MSVGAPAATHATAEREHRVETPEHVLVGYTLADLGSRFAALVLDALLLVGVLLALLLLVPLGISRVWTVPAWLAAVGQAVGTLAAFATIWGYFVYWEGLRDGQTPGKRALGIRVVHDGGYPVTVRGAVIRNLLRLIDIQPAPSWAVGGLAMLVHPQTKRLGDLAADTLVVRERATPVLPEEQEPRAAAAGPPRLSPEQMAALERYVARREGLRPAVRARIAEQLWARLAAAAEEAAAPAAQAGADARLLHLYAEEQARHHPARLSTGTPQAAALVRQRRRAWDAYFDLLEQAQRRGLDCLPEAEVRRFGALYRGVAADLARARTYGGSPSLLYSLERGVGGGHNLLYRPALRSGRQLRQWIAGGFPALVRRRWKVVLLASALFYLPALLTFAAVRLDPPRARALVPAVIIARAEEAEQRAAAGRGYVDVPPLSMPLMASGLIANNVQVTFAAFAGGVAAGVGTLLILAFNGVHLGSVAALFANLGQSMHLWSFVLPHGAIELTAICIAGGAGLWMGSALLMPGRRTRRDALVERGREAVLLIAGTTLLLVVAGVIEGFISPALIPQPLKLALAGLFALLLVAYLLLAGRDEEALQGAHTARQRGS